MFFDSFERDFIHNITFLFFPTVAVCLLKGQSKLMDYGSEPGKDGIEHNYLNIIILGYIIIIRMLNSSFAYFIVQKNFSRINHPVSLIPFLDY